MKPLSERFAFRYSRGELPSFIIIRTAPMIQDPTKALKEWALSILKHLGLGPEHPDVLWIQKGEKNAIYLVDSPEIKDFFRFQEYRPLQAIHRLAIVEDAHLISKRLSNKLLKTLEDVQPQTSVLFLTPTHKKFLPTVEGRAITLILKPEGGEERDQLPSRLEEALERCLKEGKGEHSVISIIRNSREKQDKLLGSLIDYHRNHPSHFERSEALLHNLRWYFQAQIFYNSPTERWCALLKV